MKCTLLTFRLLAGALIMVMGLLAISPSAHAARAYAAGKTFTVNSTLDAPDATAGDGKCETANGNNTCTLRAAIMETNALAGADTINLPSGATFILTRAGDDTTALNGDLDIAGDLSIIGAGATIDGGALDRVLDIHSGIVAIYSVTIQNGDAHDGGGIDNNGTLTLSDSAVKGNSAYAYGGGIENNGTLTLNNSAVSGNTDSGPAANGGGIFNSNTLTVISSALYGNTAAGGGGGIANYGTASFLNSTISGNSGPYGGGLRNGFKITIADSIVGDNSAAQAGGGLFNEGNSVATIAGSTFSNNTSVAGGGIANDGVLTAAGSTLSGNSATGIGLNDGGGALSNYYGAAALTNSTLTANSARQSGGAILNNSGTTNLSNVTIYANMADADNNNVGDGAGIYNSNAVGSVVQAKNSIIASNWRSLALGPVQDCYGWLNSGDYNLFQNVVSCNFTGTTTHNKIASPVLGQLQNNGGATQTNALNPGSPAIDMGNPNGCTDNLGALLTSDQRGYARTAGVACDIGAYEYGSALLKQNQTIIFGQLPNQMMNAAPFQINATASSALTVDFSASGKCSVSASSLNQGLSSATITLSGQGGTCTITAHQAGNATYNAAADAVRTFAITTQTQTLSFAPLPNKALGDPPFQVSVTASSGLPVSLTPDTPLVCDVVGTTVTLKTIGTCSLLASQDGNDQFAPAPDVSRSFTVSNPSKQNQTISFAPLSNKSAGDPPFNISAVASSGLPVIFTTSGQCSISSTKVTLTGAGNCTITAHQAGDVAHNAAADVAQSFKISASGPAHWIVYLPRLVR